MGWTFRPDDPFIGDFGVEAGKFPVVTDGVKFDNLQTKGPAATLVLGLIFTILAMLAIPLELIGCGVWMDLNIAKVSTVLMAVCFLGYC